MAALRHFLHGFLAGELDPMLGARVDTEQYAYGLAKCENFVAVNEGPLVKRPGYEFIRDADPTSTWLTGFRFSITQEYVVEWGEAKARFFTNGGRIETAPNVAYEIVTPYAAADAPVLSQQQSFDRLYLAHGSYPPAALRRDSAVTFTLETLVLENGPFADLNVQQGLPLTITGVFTVAGAVALAGNLGFTADHVGALVYIEAQDFSTYKVWEPGMATIAGGEYVRSDGKVYVCSDPGSGITGSWQPVHLAGAEWDGQGLSDVNTNGPYGVEWTYVHDLFGIVKIDAVTDASNATGVVQRRIPAGTSPMTTYYWAHGLFSDAVGWPGLVTLWLGRMILFKDFELIASVAGDFGGGRVNFATRPADGISPDLGFRRQLWADNPPLWLVEDRKLIAGTATREIAIGPTNPQAALSGDNISAEPQSFYGSEAVTPIQAGTENIFVERGGRRLRAADYDFARDRYDAPDLTAAARHITKGGILQLAHQRVPFPLIYGVRGDGQLIVHAKTRGEVKGFSRIKLGGDARVLSAVSIVDDTGGNEELWLLVERTRSIGGAAREIWKQAPWRELGDDQKAAFFVDGGVTVAAAAGQTEFEGLIHLAWQEVAVLANGGVVPGMVVDGTGTLTLPAEAVPDVAYTLIVGLPYTAEAISLRPAAQMRGQFINGLRMRLVRIISRVLETLGLKVGSPGGSIEEPIERSASDDMDEPIPLFSGDTPGLVEAEFDRNGQARWISSDPLPAIVMGASLSIDVDEKDA